jgi:hypothetical protein
MNIKTKAALKRYLKPGISLKMTYGFLAGTANDTRKIISANSVGVKFEGGSFLRFDQEDEVWEFSETGFSLCWQEGGRKILSYEYVS